MSKVIVRPKTREEWLEYRKDGIGSSEIGTILGVNEWETPYQLWLRKTGQTPPKEETFAMKAGHYLEDAVSMFWQDETGRQVIKSSATDFIVINKDRPFLRASPDRTYWIPGMPKNEDNKGILECKTTLKNIESDDLPMTWFCQLQYILGVSELECGSLAWLQGGRDFAFKDVNFLPDFFEWMCQAAEKFWTENVLGGVEPALTSSEDVLKKFASHFDGKMVDATENLMLEVSRLKDIKAQIKELETKKDGIEEQVKLYMMDAELLAFGGQKLATWKTAKGSQKFNDKAFAAAHPGLYSEFLVSTPGSRRFLLK